MSPPWPVVFNCPQIGRRAQFEYGFYEMEVEGLELEAPPGFEPGVEVLQTSALPLGDGADRARNTERASRARVTLQQLTTESSEEWSGKRDSNPRLRPWQGRTLPLSYSRSPEPLT